MKIIKKIGVKNIGVFTQGAVLNIEPGVTYLYGKYEADEGDTSNGAGKSTFASSIVELFYNPAIGTKQDKIKTGTRFVEYIEEGKKVKISSSYVNGKETKHLVVNGEEKSGRTLALTAQAIEKHWELTETDFISYAYSDSRLAHPLVNGTSVVRKEFFTTFFGLDKLDAERKLFLAEMSKLKKTKAAYAELKATFVEIKKDMLTKEQRIELESSCAELKKRIDYLRASADKAQNVRRLLEFEQYAKPHLEKVSNNIEQEYKQVKAEYVRGIAHNDLLEEWRDYKQQLTKYEQQCAGLDMDTPISELEEAYLELKSLPTRVPRKPVKPESISKPDSNKYELVDQLKQLKHQLSHSKEFKSGKCYACGQPVAALPVEQVEKKVKRAQSQLNEWSRYEEYESALAEYKEKGAEHKKAVRQMQSADKLKEKATLYKKRMALNPPDKVAKPNVKEVDLVALKEKQTHLEFLMQHLETINELRALTDKDRALVFDPTELNKLQDTYSKQFARLDVHNTVKNRATDIRNRLKDLEKEAERESALQLLIDAYSEKAIKKMVIESISQHLMKLINNYAALVFDDYRFEFVWGAQIQILVHRPTGVSDVRRLSGAESKLFTLILIFALLGFVPNRKRVSLLILDEPTASFDPTAVPKFHKLLPYLMQVIPSILIVTPKTNERLEGAIEYTVHRTMEGARLVKKHPDEI